MNRQQEQLAAYLAPEGGGQVTRPLELGGRDFSEALPGTKFELVFQIVPPEVVQRFDNRRRKQLLDPESGELSVVPNYWAGLVCLCQEKMLVGGTLPKLDGLTAIGSFKLPSTAPNEMIGLIKKHLRFPFVQAIVEVASEVYIEVAEQIEEDLGNLPPRSDETAMSDL